MNPQSRVKRVMIPARQYADNICKRQKYRIEVVEGVPTDAKLVRFDYDICSDRVVAVYEHETFPEVPEGTMIPEFYPLLSTTMIPDQTFEPPLVIEGTT